MSATGHEDEFRLLFAQEAEERLANLGRQLLELEQDASDPELIASIFREAHTLKGAAAVVGLEEVGVVAHAMEDLLEQLRAGERLATPALIDAVLAAVDGLEEMLPGVLAGEDRMAAARTLEARLRQLTEAGHHSAPPEEDTASSTVDQDRPAEDAVTTDDPREDPAGEEPGRGEPVADPPVPTRRAQAVIDAETVRVPLARLDELVRLVGESAAAHLRVGRMVGERLGVDPGAVDEVRELSRVLNELQEKAMRARMVPVATMTDVLQRAVREVARSTGKNVRWEARGEDTELDRGVLAQLSDPLLHLVRNAVDHGIESPAEREAAGKPEQAVVRLHAMQLGSEVIVTVSDDGKGIDVARVRSVASRQGTDASGLSDEEALYLVFRSGLSTASFVSDISGRGVGLDVVRANVEAARGRIEIHTELGVGSEFRIIVPITLAVLPCLLVEAGGRRHAIPMHSIVVAQAEGDESRSEGHVVVWTGAKPVPLSNLAGTLGLTPDETGPIVVVAGLTRRHAFRVGQLIGQRDVVVKGLSRLLPRLDVLAGASVEPDGSILLVLDVPGLIDRARLARSRGGPAIGPSEDEPAATPGQRRSRLLVVDDAMTVRELQRSILERAGYEVITAVDGVDAMARLAEGPVDLVLTDVEMPRMDGFALTEAIRAQPNRSNVPVLILTSRASEADRQRGLEAGADGYIVKSAFNEAALVTAVERLLGR
ncbi:MAG TPA: hybrid sensor histidine kinase/response regulator [Acidimicrobiales bacterium]|nr:hybrid sensor histidine kinase/response regulator [Acidimicrobiales bacterium]